MAVVDIHTHMFGPAWMKLFREHRAPGMDLIPMGPDRTRLVVDGVPDLVMLPAIHDYGLRIKDMDAHGIDIAVVSLTSPNCFFGGPEVSLAVARAVNDEMAAAQTTYPDRIRFFASIPWEYPDLAVPELERALGLGAVGVMVLAHINELHLIDDALAPVWQAIDRHALPVLVHPTTVYAAEKALIHKIPFLLPSVGFTYDTTLALTQMAMTGFLDRYPNVKIIGSHGGGYVPFIATRLDMFQRCSGARPDAPEIDVMAQLSRVYLDAVVYQPEVLDLCIKLVGADKMLFGTDYPMPADFDKLHELTLGLSADQARAVRGGNAARIFNL